MINSKESIEDSIRRGYKVIEIDVALTSDKIPVVSHDYTVSGIKEHVETPDAKTFLSSPLCGKYTPLTVKQLFDFYGNNGVWFAIDGMSIDGFDMIGWLSENAPETLRRRLILQLATLTDVRRMKDDDSFGALHFCIGYDLLHGSTWLLRRVANMLKVCGVTSVSFGEQRITDDITDKVSLLNDFGLVVSVARVNTKPRVDAWRKIGVKCFDSDLLDPSSLCGD